MGQHTRAESGRGAWVALCTYPTHTDNDADTDALKDLKSRDSYLACCLTHKC
jgi:hypothetical protein